MAGYKVIRLQPVTEYKEVEVEISLPQYIGENIKKRREELGMTQTELHDKSMHSVEELSHAYSAAHTVGIENGSRIATISSLQSIAAALDMHITELFPPVPIKAGAEVKSADIIDAPPVPGVND